MKPIDPEWIRDFEASLRRPLSERFDYSFVWTPKPVIDDRPYLPELTTRSSTPPP